MAKQTYGVNVPEVRAQMGRAHITQVELAELSGLHAMTILRILNTGRAQVATVGALADGLNAALRQAGQPTITVGQLITVVSTEESQQPMAAVA